jgi:hypothetical protein
VNIDDMENLLLRYKVFLPATENWVNNNVVYHWLRGEKYQWQFVEIIEKVRTVQTDIVSS